MEAIKKKKERIFERVFCFFFLFLKVRRSRSLTYILIYYATEIEQWLGDIN